MSTKKTAAADTVPVTKTIVVEIKRLDGARAERELWEEFRAKLAQGYTVTQQLKTHAGVEIQLQKVEDWTMDEFISGIRAKLAGGGY